MSRSRLFGETLLLIRNYRGAHVRAWSLTDVERFWLNDFVTNPPKWSRFGRVAAGRCLYRFLTNAGSPVPAHAGTGREARDNQCGKCPCAQLVRAPPTIATFSQKFASQKRLQNKHFWRRPLMFFNLKISSDSQIDTPFSLSFQQPGGFCNANRFPL